MIQRLTGELDFQAQALMLRAERQRLLASNIANADTPGYQARDFVFADALRQAAATRPALADAAGAGGDDARLGEPIATDLLDGGTGAAPAAPTLVWSTAAQTNLDDNGVDLDRERAAFADNALKYESTLRFVNAGVRNLQDAMKSPNQA